MNVEKYNQKDDDKMCKCGHTYYRHFDPQDSMKFSGCKFCGCNEFIEVKPSIIDVAKQLADVAGVDWNSIK